MIELRSPQEGDSTGLALAWEDAREYYSSLDPQAFNPPNHDDADLGAWLLAYLSDIDREPDRFVSVAEHKGRAVGFVVGGLRPPRPDAERELLADEARVRGTVDVIAVQRAHWRTGIGRALMQAVERWALDQGASLVVLTTYEASPVAVPFYEALGYERRAVILVRYLDG